MRISTIVLLVCSAVGCGSGATPAKDGKGPDAGDAARSEAATPDGSGDVATAPDVSQGSDAGDAPGESSTDVAPDGTGDATLDGPAEATTDRSGDVTALGDASGDGDTGATWSGADGPCDTGCRHITTPSTFCKTGTQTVEWVCQGQHDRTTFEHACAMEGNAIRYCCAPSFLPECQ
jgi:hypothetical protein